MTDTDKLKQFAKLIGIPVVKQNGPKGDGGAFIYDGPDSHIVMHHSDALTLLHEMGHALDWIQQGRPGAGQIPKQLGMATKKMRRQDRFVIWVFERKAIYNMKLIHTMLQLEIPKGELRAMMMHDLWCYSSFYRKGKYPTYRERKQKYKHFTAMYKDKA